MHDRHVSHGDIRLCNMMVHKDRMLFCDFGFSSINATSHVFAQDFDMLDEVMLV